MSKASLDLYPDDMIEKNLAGLCFKRRQQPEDLPGVVMFLSSEDSDFITGQTIVVDGGCMLH